MAMKIKIKELDKLRRNFSRIDKQAAKVEAYTISTIKRRVPAIVSKSVATVYNIPQGEVAQAQRTKKSLSDKAFSRENKKHLSTKFKGTDLESLYVVFTGRKHANWSTKAKPNPKPRGGKVFSTQKKYTVYQTVLKKKTVPISPAGDNRVFVMMRKGKLIPMVVGENNKPLVKASTSVPQAVLNPDVVKIWRPQIDALVVDEFARQTKRYWNGEI